MQISKILISNAAKYSTEIALAGWNPAIGGQVQISVQEFEERSDRIEDLTDEKQQRR